MIRELHKKSAELESLRESRLKDLMSAYSYKAELDRGCEQELLAVKSVMNEIRRWLNSREQSLEQDIRKEYENLRCEHKKTSDELEKSIISLDHLLAVFKQQESSASTKLLFSL